MNSRIKLVPGDLMHRCAFGESSHYPITYKFRLGLVIAVVSHSGLAMAKLLTEGSITHIRLHRTSWKKL